MELRAIFEEPDLFASVHFTLAGYCASAGEQVWMDSQLNKTEKRQTQKVIVDQNAGELT